MEQYILGLKATCDVCGCTGKADIRTAGEAWNPNSFISHRDPQVCAYNLKMKEKQKTPNPPKQ